MAAGWPVRNCHSDFSRSVLRIISSLWKTVNLIFLTKHVLTHIFKKEKNRTLGRVVYPVNAHTYTDTYIHRCSPAAFENWYIYIYIYIERERERESEREREAIWEAREKESARECLLAGVVRVVTHLPTCVQTNRVDFTSCAVLPGVTASWIFVVAVVVVVVDQQCLQWTKSVKENGNVMVSKEIFIYLFNI